MIQISKSNELSKPEVILADTDTLAAMREIFEDRLATVVHHMQDATTLEGKPCKITLEIVVTPNKARTMFSCSTSGKATLSPHIGAETTIFANPKQGGGFELVEYKPQTEIPFS